MKHERIDTMAAWEADRRAGLLAYFRLRRATEAEKAQTSPEPGWHRYHVTHYDKLIGKMEAGQ